MTDLFQQDLDETTTTSLDLRRLQRQKRRQTRHKWTLVFSAVGLVIFAFGGSLAWEYINTFIPEHSNEIADYEGAGQGVVQVIVDPGDSGTVIAQKLYEAGVVASPEAYVRVASASPETVTPGYYFLQREMRAEFALAALLDPGNRNELTVTIPEGHNKQHYFQAIANLTDSTAEEVAEIAKDTDALGLPEEAGGNLEGWLFPATYTFQPNAQPADILAEMVAETVTRLDKIGVPAEERQKILTIASIIEKEARLAEDRPLVGGVIHNRLAIDMRLEMDSTIKYFAPSEGWATSDEDRATDSPYNTYMYEGLPPTPIAAPGEAAIKAAFDPADHDYIFFVTVNTLTGETKYAETFDGHQKNVLELQEWAREQREAREAEEGSEG